MNRVTVAAVTTAAAALALTLVQPSAYAATATAWTAPTCTRVVGDGAVTFTTDDGASLTATSGTLKPISYTHGLVALGTANTLLATRNDEIQRSTDAGCSWTHVANLGSGSPTLTAGVGSRAFAWEPSGSTLARIDGTTVTRLTSPVTDIVGLGTDPADAGHVRLAGNDGKLYDSRDGGATWTAVGTPAFPAGTGVYSVAFDPKNPDHAVAGAMVLGGAVTTDGGATWTASTGLTAGTSANLFRTAVSPANPSVVYGIGIDLAEAVPGSGNEGRHLYRSTDGGRTFAKIVDDTAEHKLTNSTLLAPSPVDPAVLYFEYGTYFQGYGTDLLRHDAGTGLVTKTHNAYDGIDAIAFNPARPSVMYLGVEEVGTPG
ncbi:WD40/YVTN/BNR-like repeat-containing protein [Streptomyces sp. NPDC004327]|uniref:WD40/YVTN/BNR-like repeat-containing protein n=1 Tax=unclassified Streptomyces TaxID=2593676 RepID=UPI0036A3814D